MELNKFTYLFTAFFREMKSLAIHICSSYVCTICIPNINQFWFDDFFVNSVTKSSLNQFDEFLRLKEICSGINY